jgi:GntR family transcriptional regulator
MLQTRSLDKNVPIPLYYQLKTIILEEIDVGAYPPGSMIPIENELIDIFQISRTTVRQAISELVQEGRLYRIKSKGTFVAKPKINFEFKDRMYSFNAPNSEEIIRSGRTPSTEVMSLDVIKATDYLANILNIAPKSDVVCLYRRRCADDEPIVRVKTYLPYKTCGFMLEYDFTKNGLYDTLSTREETRICRMSRICEAIAAGPDDVETLFVKRGSPIHHFRTIGYNAKDEPTEYSEAFYRGDQNQFHIEIVLNAQ